MQFKMFLSVKHTEHTENTNLIERISYTHTHTHTHTHTPHKKKVAHEKRHGTLKSERQSYSLTQPLRTSQRVSLE